jgi:hypothetical protein
MTAEENDECGNEEEESNVCNFLCCFIMNRNRKKLFMAKEEEEDFEAEDKDVYEREYRGAGVAQSV